MLKKKRWKSALSSILKMKQNSSMLENKKRAPPKFFVVREEHFVLEESPITSW